MRSILLLIALCAAPQRLPAQSLAAGDTLHLRLLDRLGSDHRAPKRVHARIIAPVLDDSARVIIPPGSTLTGRVTGSGMERFGGKRHWVALDFDSLAIPLGNTVCDSARAAIAIRLIAVDDAREIIDTAGRIVGPPIPSLIHSKRDWAVALLGVFHPIGAIVLAATLEGERAERHRKIAFESGVEMTAVLTRDLALDQYPVWSWPPPVTHSALADSIAAIAPLHTQLRYDGPPSDVIAIAVIGTAAQVSAAFAAAGWTLAVPMTLRSDFVTFVKAAKGQGYSAQPVSELVLGGRPPDRVYEKVADTFMKRHHLRMWRWPLDSASSDSTLWLIAATHDVGVTFSRQRRSFTHRVDVHIDDEREKVVSDLVAADAVSEMSYIVRPAPKGGAAKNSGSRRVTTDWRLAVLVLTPPRK